MNIAQNITPAELPWLTKTLYTFRSIVMKDITTRSSSWGNMSCKSELVNYRVGSLGWSGPLVSRDITARVYCLEAELPSPKNPTAIMFKSPWTGVSSVWSLIATSPFGSSWLTSRYSFKNPSLTRLASWKPKAMHRYRLCPNARWNSHQAPLHDPKNRFVFWGNFSLFSTPSMLKSSL